MCMAEQHFREVNSDFRPHSDWQEDYFHTIQSNPQFRLCWIVADDENVGFILYGTEKHRFLPRTTGTLYELYVKPEHRRRGYAKECALLAIEELNANRPSKIQLEITCGSRAAEALWTSLGFQKVSERMVLRCEKIK